MKSGENFFGSEWDHGFRQVDVSRALIPILVEEVGVKGTSDFVLR